MVKEDSSIGDLWHTKYGFGDAFIILILQLQKLM